MCQCYYFDSTYQDSQLIDANDMILFYHYQTKYSFQISVNRVFQELSYLTSNNANINKTSLIFYEFKNLQQQNANAIIIKGNSLQMANVTARKIYFSDSNWYSPFYMPYWSSYGQILYLQIDSQMSVTLNKARTDQSNDVLVPRGFIAMFVNDFVKWKFVASMNKTLFLASFN